MADIPMVEDGQQGGFQKAYRNEPDVAALAADLKSKGYTREQIEAEADNLPINRDMLSRLMAEYDDGDAPEAEPVAAPSPQSASSAADAPTPAPKPRETFLERESDYVQAQRRAMSEAKFRDDKERQFAQSANASSSAIWSAAFVTENSAGSIIGQLGEMDFPKVEGYNPFDQREDGTTDIDGYEQFFKAFSGSRSPEQTALIKSRIDEEMANRQILANGGAEGFIATLAAGLTDPINLASMMLPAAKGGQAIDFVYTGLVANTAAEAVLHSTQITRTAEESAVNIIGSALLDGVLGTVAQTLTKPQRETLTQEIMGGHRPAGAAAVIEPTGAEISKTNPLSRLAATMTKVTPLGRTLQSANEKVRSTVQKLAESGIRLRGDAAPTAVESLVKLDYAKQAETTIKVRDIQNKFIKSTGLSEITFNSELIRAMRRGDRSQYPEVEQAAQLLRRDMDQLWENAAKARVEGTFREVDGTSVPEDFMAQRGLSVEVSNMTELSDGRSVDGLDIVIKNDAGADVGAVQSQLMPDGTLQIFNSSLDAGLRGQGIGKNAYMVLIAKAKERDINKITSDSSVSIDAQRVWESLGATKTDRGTDFTARNPQTGRQQEFTLDESPLYSLDISGMRIERTSPRVEPIRSTTSESYMTRRYDLNVIRNDPEGFKRAWIAGINDQRVRNNETPLDPTDAYEVANDIYDKIINLRMGDLHYNIGPSGAAQTKARVDVQDSFLEDYLVKDWEALFEGYVKSLSPRVRMQEQFGDFRLKDQLDAIQEEYSLAISQLDRRIERAEGKERNKLVREKGKLSDKMQSEIRDIEIMRDRILNVPQEPSLVNPENRGILSALRAARSWNIVTSLSNMLISSIPDMARLITYQGAGRFAKAFARSALSREIRRSNLPTNQLAKIASAMERASAYRLSNLTEVEDGVVYTRGDKYAHKAADVVLTASGSKHWNSVTKTMVGYLFSDRLGRALRGTNVDDTAKLKQIGLDGDLLTRARSQARAHAFDDDGLYNLNLEQWTDRELVETIEAAAVREADLLVITPSAGDKPIFFTTEVGRTIFQFKSFMLAATNRLTLPITQEGGARPWLEILTHVGLGMGVYALKQKIADREISDDPTLLVAEAVENTGLAGYGVEFAKMGATLTGYSPLESEDNYQSHASLTGILGPTAAAAESALRIPNSNNSGEARAKAIRKLMPMQNHFILRSGYDKIEEDLARLLGAGPKNPKF